MVSAIIVATYPIQTIAAVGKIEFATGVVKAVSADGRSRELSKGANIENGDTLKTLNGRAQLKFTDGGYISLQPYTDFKVEDYEFNGTEDGKEKSVFTLLKGGLRAVTGSIGHKNKDNFKLNTSTATIGIRGTEFLVTLNGETLRVFCGNGGVFVKNEAGTLVLYQGQSGVVGGPNSAPQQSTDVPTVTSASPTGNTNTSSESNGSGDTQAIIANGNIRLDADSLCQTGSGDCITQEVSISNDPSVLLLGGLSNIPLLNQFGAFAGYFGTSSITIAGSTAPVDTFLFINFTDYTTEFDVFGIFNNAGVYANHFLDAFVDGSLNVSTGAITFDSQTSTGSSISLSMGSVPISVSASGSLSASNLSVALILYSISDGSNFGSSSTTLNGQIFTDESEIPGQPPTIPPDANTLLQGGLANIPLLNGINALASYTGSSTLNLGMVPGAITVNETLTIAFSNYSTAFVIDSGANTFVGGSFAGETLSGAASAILDPGTGAMNFSGGNFLITGITPTPGTFTAITGSLNPSSLSQATIGYTVTELTFSSSDTVAPHPLSGIAQ